jgi:hypothetical protein
MIENFLAPDMCHLFIQNVWIQQDGATSHTARISMDMLWNIFSGWLISRFGDIIWLSWSPDLIARLLFVGYAKGSCLPDMFSNDWGPEDMRLPLFHKKSYRRQCLVYYLGWTNVLLVKEVTWKTLFPRNRTFMCLHWISKALWIFWWNSVITCVITLSTMNI